MDPTWAWRVLGVPPGASAESCRTAFRTAAQLLHPDRVADLADDVRAEAHRRMVELAEAYRVCSALAAGRSPVRTRRTVPTGATTLAPVGGLAAELLAEAEATSRQLATWDTYRAHLPTTLDWTANAEQSREVIRTLEHVADAWPGTAEGDRARALLVTSVAARNSLSPRERANHLVLVLSETARAAAWDGLAGRDELAVAQVVYAHPTASAELRARARARLAALDDWATLSADGDPDIGAAARAHVLVQEARGLVERAPWLSKRERPAFDVAVAGWRERAETARAGGLVDTVRADLDEADRAIAAALRPARTGRG